MFARLFRARGASLSCSSEGMKDVQRFSWGRRTTERASVDGEQQVL